MCHAHKEMGQQCIEEGLFRTHDGGAFGMMQANVRLKQLVPPQTTDFVLQRIGSRPLFAKR